MKRPTSLTLRLTLLFAAVTTVVFLAFGWVIERSIEEHFIAQDSKELQVVAKAVTRSLSTQQPNQDLTRTQQRFDDMLVGHHSASLLITDATGQHLYASPGADHSLIPLQTDQLRQGEIILWNNGEQNYRVFVQQVTDGDNAVYTVIIAVAIDFHLHFLTQFRHTLWLMVAVAILVMGLMGWLAVRQGHRPLHTMVEQISRISANELNTRLTPASVPAELVDLAVSFNELLQRMERAFNRLSHFSADIAHELRTPVTNLMTQTQVALSQSRDAAAYQEILYSNMEEYERMAQMIGDMLFLAKADNASHPPNVDVVDLKSELHNLFDYYGAWAEECHVSLVQQGEACVRGDRLMLRRALSNLLSNAIRHTPDNHQVTIKLSHLENQALIQVQNPGTPIPTEHLNKVFDRFYRTDPSRQRGSDGAGLGLAIVQSIIEVHGGTITVTSDEFDTRFSLSLPGFVDG